MKFLNLLNPVPGIKDFAQELARPRPYRWRIALLAAATTFGIFSVMWGEEMIGAPARPEITYITTFAPERTREEIIASNLANQQVKDRLAAEQAERDRKVKEMYRTLGRMSGMDVDRIEREAAAQSAAEEKAKPAQTPAARNPPDAAGQD